MTISPREHILKSVRKNLLGFKNNRTPKVERKLDAFRNLGEPEGLQALREKSHQSDSQVFECSNKYHFLDALIDFSSKRRFESIQCADHKLIRLLESCDIPYSTEFADESTGWMQLQFCDYWEPGGLVASFDYSTDSAEKLDDIQVTPAFVAYRDQMVKSSAVLFERLKNRLRDSDLQKVDIFSLDASSNISSEGADIKPQPIVIFIINQRL